MISKLSFFSPLSFRSFLSNSEFTWNKFKRITETPNTICYLKQLWFKATFKNKRRKMEWDMGLGFFKKYYYYWLVLTYFLCFLGGENVLNWQMHSSEILFHAVHMERLKVQFHGLCAGSALTGCKSITCKDRMQLYNRHILISLFFLLLMTLFWILGWTIN